jgi:hypothetical protein
MSDYQNYSSAPPPMETTTSTLAIVSLVAGILSWVMLPLIGSIVAIITGHMAKGEIKRSHGVLTGDGFATAGLVLGYLQIALGFCGLCVFLILMVMGIGLSDFSGTLQGMTFLLP